MYMYIVFVCEFILIFSCRRIADKNLFNGIIHLSLIPLAESNTLHLLAITKVTLLIKTRLIN